MPAYAATAPGKIILFGEHAVVYGQPAIAVPVTQVRARAQVTADLKGAPGQVWIKAEEIGLDADRSSLPDDHPLAMAVAEVAREVGIDRLPALRLQISSTIPVASGLGSGAAVTVAIARALSAFLGHPLSDEQVSSIAFEVDKRYHGTPSGIDNTVITYAQPVFYTRGRGFERLHVAERISFVIGHTGVSSQTGVVVGDVRRRWQAHPQPYEQIFADIGALVLEARQVIEQGQPENLGLLLMRNHTLLQQLDVSSPELDRLVEAAVFAGSPGAKLCGAGRGGNMVALASLDTAPAIASALQSAGAISTIITTINDS